MILTPTTAAPGAAITAKGRAAKKRQTRIRVDGAFVLGFTTGGNGQYTRTITVPSRGDGVYPVTVEQLTDAWRQVDHAETPLTIKNPVVSAPVPTPEPEPTPEPTPQPVPAPAGYVIQPGTGTIAKAIADGHRELVLRGGTYRDSFGSVHRTDVVSLVAATGEIPLIQPYGDQHFVYLGAGAHWTLRGIHGSGFRPLDSGVFGPGDGDLTFEDVEWVGAGAPVDSRSHGVYLHGTGTFRCDRSKLTKFPGGAVTAYRGTPRSIVNDSDLGSLYESGLIYDGSHVWTRVRFVEPTAAWDVQVDTADLTLVSCIGTGAGGTVRRVG